MSIGSFFPTNKSLTRDLTSAFIAALNAKDDDPLSQIASAIKYDDKGRVVVDPKVIASEAKQKSQKTVDRAKKGSDTAVAVKEAIQELQKQAQSLESAVSALTTAGYTSSSLYNTSTATLDATLQGAVDVTATAGAAAVSHTVQVNSLAATQKYVITCLDATGREVGFPAGGTAGNVIAPAIGGGVAAFSIVDSTGAAHLFNINNADSLTTIMGTINGLGIAGLTASITTVNASTNTAQLVIESNGTGTANHFFLLPPVGLPAAVKTYAPNAQTIDIYKPDGNGFTSIANRVFGDPGDPVGPPIIPPTPAVLNPNHININGVDIDLTLVPPGDTVNALIDEINALDSITGVSATYKSVSVDGGAAINVIRLTSNRPEGISVDWGFGAQAFLLDPNKQVQYTNSSDAEIRIDRGLHTSPTNTFTSPVTGVDSLTVTNVTKGVGSLEIGPNADAIKAAIKNLVDVVNNLEQFIAYQSQLDENHRPLEEAVLCDKPILRDLQSTVDRIIGRVAGITPGNISSLLDIGISWTNFPGNSAQQLLPARNLTVNDAVLNAALADPTKLSQVRALFDTTLVATVGGGGGGIGGVASVNQVGTLASTPVGNTTQGGLSLNVGLSDPLVLARLSALTGGLAPYTDMAEWPLQLIINHQVFGAFVNGKYQYLDRLGGLVCEAALDPTFNAVAGGYNMPVTAGLLTRLVYTYIPSGTENILATGTLNSDWTRNLGLSFLPAGAVASSVTVNGALDPRLTPLWSCTKDVDMALGDIVFNFPGTAGAPVILSIGGMNPIIPINNTFDIAQIKPNTYSMIGRAGGVYEGLNFLYTADPILVIGGGRDTLIAPLYIAPAPGGGGGGGGTVSTDLTLLPGTSPSFNVNSFSVNITMPGGVGYAATATPTGGGAIGLDVIPLGATGAILKGHAGSVFEGLSMFYNPAIAGAATFTNVSFARGIAASLHNYLDNYANSTTGPITNALQTASSDVTTARTTFSQAETRQQEDVRKAIARYIKSEIQKMQMEQSAMMLESMMSSDSGF